MKMRFMRAMQANKPGPIEESPLQMVELPLPKPGPQEIRIRVSVCGVCRTDLHVLEGDLPVKQMPVVPGHQIVGTVEKLGQETSRFRVGDRVGIAWLRYTCGTCAYCRREEENLCPDSLYTGYHADGGFAEYAVVPEAYAYALPAVFTNRAAAPLLCAGIIGYRAFLRSRVPDGGRLGIYGFGSSAHITLQIAQHLACTVYVFTRNPNHGNLARELGAAWIGHSDDPPPELLDGAILFAPIGSLVPPAMRALRRGGTLAIAGIHLTPIPEMTYEEHLFHEKQITSAEANTRANGEDLLCVAAEIPVHSRVVTYSLEEANQALIDLKAGRINGTAVLRIGEGQS